MGRDEVREMEEKLSRRVDGVVRAAKLVRFGDEAIFDFKSKIFEVWTVREGERSILLAVRCPWITDPTHFRNFAQLIGLNAEPKRAGLHKSDDSPESFWTYSYI